MWNNVSWTDWLSSSFPFPLIYLNLKSAWRKKGLSHFLLITLSLSSLQSFSQQHFPFRSLLFAEDDGQDNESESLSVESGRVGPGPRTSRIVCGLDVDVMAPAPAPAQVPVPGGWPQFHSRYWRKHAGSTPRPRPPRLCWRSLLRQLIGSLLIDDQLSPDVRPNSWFVSLLLVVTRFNSKRLLQQPGWVSHFTVVYARKREFK